MNWKALREAIMIVIGISMVILMTDIRSAQNDAEDRGYRSRASTCRVVLALNQPVEPDDPCNDPQVKAITDTFEIVPVGSGADHKRTQTILCKYMEQTIVGAPEECKEILSAGR